MKKIFTFFAAMLFALTANATTTWNITDAKNDTLLKVILAATGGDTIVMEAGTYAEGVSAGEFYIDKSLVIKAAADANVTIQPQLPMLVRKGSRVEFIGVKFDATNLRKRVAWPETVILAYDASDGNKLIFEGCEFCNDTIKKPFIRCSSSNKLDSCIINNCKVHDTYNFLFLENSGLIGLNVTNSTFYKISSAPGYSAGIIDPRGSSAKVRVDQCTFYNCEPVSTDYGVVKVANSTAAVVSNSIFMMPSSTALRAIHMKSGNQVKNCIVYNYTASTNGIHYNVTPSDCQFVDPLFADAANNNFTPNEETSPAKGTGVGGTHLGDPRWWPASWQPAAVIHVSSVALDHEELTLDVNETAFLHATVLPAEATYPDVTWTTSDDTKVTVVNGTVKGIAAGTATITATADGQTATCDITVSDAIPSTDFASPYFLKGTKAALSGNIFVNEADSLYYNDEEVCGIATWNLRATATGYITATINFKSNNASGAKCKIQIIDSADDVVGEDSLDYWNKPGDKVMPHKLCIPAEGVYTIKLFNNQEYSSSKINGVTLTYDSALPAAVSVRGEWDSWTSDVALTMAKNGKTASGTKHFEANQGYEIKVINGGTWVRDNNKWHFYYATNECSNITNTSDGNMKLWTDFEGDYIFTWTYETSTLTITYPVAVESTKTIYYVNKDNWSAVKAYAYSPAYIGWPGEAATLTEYTYEGHAIYSYEQPANRTNVIFVDADNNNNKTGDLTLEDGKPYYYDGTWYSSLPGVPTAIDNTVVGEKAVKLMENGQLVIIKNGVRYNVLGTVVR